jgi:hypothetical protein
VVEPSKRLLMKLCFFIYSLPFVLDLSDGGIQVRVWNLPKKKNIHKDLKQAFKGFPGLLAINPAVSANKKTRDPICKGFTYLKMESMEVATRYFLFNSFNLFTIFVFFFSCDITKNTVSFSY